MLVILEFEATVDPNHPDRLEGSTNSKSTDGAVPNSWRLSGGVYQCSFPVSIDPRGVSRKTVQFDFDFGDALNKELTKERDSI